MLTRLGASWPWPAQGDSGGKQWLPVGPSGLLQELDDFILVSRELEFWEILSHSREVGCGCLPAGRVVGWGQGHSLEATRGVGWSCPGLAGWGNGCQFTIFIPSLPCHFVHSVYFNISIFICLWLSGKHTHTHSHMCTHMHTCTNTPNFVKRKARQVTVSFWKKKERKRKHHTLLTVWFHRPC